MTPTVFCYGELTPPPPPDYTDPSGGPYDQKPRYQTGYADASGLGSDQQRSDDWGQGTRAGPGTTLDPSRTSDQYGGSERTASGQTGGYADTTTGRTWQGERDDDTAGSGKPSVTSKLKGTSGVELCWRLLM